MKKLGMFAVLLLGLISCTPKIGYVDVPQVMKNYDGAKANEKALKKKSDNFKKELDNLVANWKAKVKTYQSKAKKMTASKRSAKEQELMIQQRAIGQRQQQIQALVQTESQQVLDSLSKKIGDFVKSYAKKNGYKFVFGTSGNGTVMYAEKGANITQNITKALNTAYKKK